MTTPHHSTIFQRFSRISFRFKLFGIFTLLTATVIIIFCSAYILIESRTERDHAIFSARLLGERLAGSIRIYLFAGSKEILQLYAEETLREPDILGVTITTADGKTLVKLQKSDGTGDSISQTVEVRSSKYAPSVEDALLGTPIDSTGTLLGTVRIDKSTAPAQAKMKRAVAVVCGTAAIFWAIVSLLGYLALRKITRSFTSLSRGVHSINSGEGFVPIKISDDEAGQVAQAINELAESLKQQEARNRDLNQALSTALSLEVESKVRVMNANRMLEEEIAERKKAEQTVRESQQTLKTLLDHLPVGVAWTSTDGTFQYLNLFFVEHFGYGREEVTTIDDWFHKVFPDADYRQQIMQSRQSAIAGIDDNAGPSTVEACVTCRDGAERHVVISNQIAKDRIIDILIDLTDRDLLQEQFIKVQKLESLSVLAGGIAHNFNNVLTGVMGYISFARKFLDSEHKSYHLLEKAEKASKRAASIAKQLLNFAQGGIQDKKPVSVLRLVEESLGMIILGTCVRTDFQLPPDLHAVIADESLLSQAITSIIINAVQAMPNGGQLTIRGDNVSLGSGNLLNLPPGEYVEFSFEDEGGGIAEEHHKKIFVPYFTTKAEVGTGLGLATAYSIITRHGGTITFKTQPGSGTTFTICLPSTGIILPQSAAGTPFIQHTAHQA